MKKKIVRFFVKQWLFIWIAVTAVGMISFIGFAEYTASENSYMKRVVVSASEQGMMFSSNYLTEGGKNSYQPCYKTVQESTSEYYQTYVRLWNYSLKNSAKVYPTDIEYKVCVKLTDAYGNAISADKLGSKYVTITHPDPANAGSTITERLDATNLVADGTSFSETFTCEFLDTLESDNGKGVENSYDVRFYGWDLSEDSDICLQMVAKPYRNGDSSKYKDLKDIGAVIGLQEWKDSESNGWRANISELQKTGVFEKSDGYNLVLTGSGKSKITIKWNTDHVDINRYINSGSSLPFNFPAQELSVAEPEGGSKWKTMTINADTSLYRNRYNLQVYTSAGVKPSADFFKVVENNDPVDDSVWVTCLIESMDDE